MMSLDIPPMAMLIDERQVRIIVSMSSRTLRFWVSAGKFPKPVRLGDNDRARKRWLRREVVEWVEKQAAAR